MNSKRELPASEVYRDECKLSPWRDMIDLVAEAVIQNTPQGGRWVDLMCGPGILLERVLEIRPDIYSAGIDIDPDFLNSASQIKTGLKRIDQLYYTDVRYWIPEIKFHVATCTGGLHHLPFGSHEQFLVNIRDKILGPGGIFILGDPHISEYHNETERKLAAEELGSDYTRELIKAGATNEIIEASIDIMYNDIFKHEYKTSFEKRLNSLERIFSRVVHGKTWPTDSKYKPYGDYWFMCTNGR